MRKIFEAELRGVGENLVEMADAVHHAIKCAGKALLTADHQLAQQVIADDAKIDQMQRDLDERCVHIIAQQAPVATDLRTLVAALRMSATLERMGDLAQHVAEVARIRYPETSLRPSLQTVFSSMIDAATDAAKDVTVLLRTRDLELAKAIERDDDILDDLHKQTFAALLSPEWDGSAQEVIDITLLGRYLERFGDHATSVSRRIVFLVTGDFHYIPQGR
ncbi:MAG: phosphate signaling complex protein PhoU [Promicromonosporaceae bacterium]|nr:phosphate signaling complex protein PhoU [Promicromonosporaceae bacterium]